jgi:hypothetical protein
MISSLKRDLSGRTYALQVHKPGSNPWIGFELIFCVRFFHSDLSFRIASKPLHLFYSLDGKQCSNGDELLLLRTDLKADEKNKSWINLTGDKASLIGNVISNEALEPLLKSIHENALLVATQRLGESMATDLDNEKKRLRILIASHSSLIPDEYEKQYSGALLALEEWRPELDSIGFLAINPSWSSR